MKRRITWLLLAQMSLACPSFAQTAAVPQPGKPLPDFTLANVQRFGKKKVSNADFKGKWLFLDFWTTSCSVCIASFPKVNGFSNEFKTSLNWVMVGKNDSRYNAGIEKMYEKIAARRQLTMPYVFDSLLIDRWEIGSVPHIVVVDPQGIVRAVTDGRDMTSEKIRDLLAGKDISFFPKDRNFKEFNPNEN